MRLIDILNKIANGELKEGTKVFIYDFAKSYNYHLVFNEGELRTWNGNIFICPFKDLNEECELIEPNHFTDIGEMAEPTDNTKIEELEAMGETKFEYGEPVPADWVMANKINEIIRYINK